jgi:hypothetical protein
VGQRQAQGTLAHFDVKKSGGKAIWRSFDHLNGAHKLNHSPLL